MRCIFCKANSDNSVSVEHVLPESLGNEDHILPPGWVCDRCNNYFAIKVEKPFLEGDFARSIRHFMRVPSKKGRIPTFSTLHCRSGTKIDLFYDERGRHLMKAAVGEDERKFADLVDSQTSGVFQSPAVIVPDLDLMTARFIAKLGLEILALKCSEIPGWNDEIVDKPELDALREYARFVRPNIIWPINIRRIYECNFQFPADAKGESYETLHEWTIHAIPDRGPCEWYAVAAIFGIEFAINLGSPELDGWKRWFKKNKGQSPLYPEGIPRISS
jgi:hypothetical protein